MANIGNLFYSVYLKDMTDADKEKIRKKVENMTARIGVTVSSSSIQKAMKSVLKGQTFKVDITPNIKKSGMGKVDLIANPTSIRRSINDALKGQTFKARVDMVVNKANVQDAIRQAFAKAGLRYDTTASDVRQNRIDTNNLRTEAYINAQKALERLRVAREQATLTADRHKASLSHVNTTMSFQSRIAGQLKEQLLNVYSVYTIQRFLTSIISIGGEFQKQHIALSAILKDAAKADVLFGRIKELAVASPYNFKDLASYTKQIAAYSIPYEELYDTTKRLADISAGLGVDMGRIILAYGQVRSAAFLRGQEVRQFTEAGIPLLDKLAEKFAMLEGRVVSVGEVFDKISRRQVSFQMVKDVLWDLTNEGGQFYNMQEVLTESLSGKLDKLKDSYQIMLADIAESNNSLLGSSLDSLTELMGHWREMANIIGSLIAAYGAYKATIMAVNALQTVLIVQKYGLAKATRDRTLALLEYHVSQGKVNAGLVTMLRNLGNLKKAFSAIGRVGWIGIIAGALAAVTTYLISASIEANRLKKELDDIAYKGVSSAQNEIDGYKILVEKLKNVVKGSQEYNDIISKIQSRYGEYLGNVRAEADAYSYLKGKIDDVTASLRNKATEQARQQGVSKITESYSEEKQSEFSESISSLQKNFRLSKEAATQLASLIQADISNGMAAGLSQGYEKAVDYIKSKAEEIGIAIKEPGGPLISRKGKYGENVVAGGASESIKHLKALSELTISESYAISEYTSNLEALSGITTVYGLKIEKLEKQYERKKANIPIDATSRLKQLYLDLLDAKEKVYKDYGQEGEIRKLEAERASIIQQTENWRTLSREKLAAYSYLQPKDDEDAMSYISRLQKEYKELQETISQSDGKALLQDIADTAKPQVELIKAVLQLLGQPLIERKSDKDSFAEKIKERLDVLKKAYSEYKEWSKLVGKEEANRRLNESGFFGETFSGENFNGTDDYGKHLDNLLGELEKAASTEERRALILQIKQLKFDIDKDAAKEASDKALKEVEGYIAETTKRWDLYKQLYSTTGDKDWAMNAAFSNPTYFDETAMQLVDSLNRRIKSRGLSINVPFTETEENANKLFGENNKELFSLWKTIKYRVEDNGADVWKSEAKAMQDYLNEFGTFQQKRLAIEKEYAVKIAEARSKGNVNESRLLENQRSSALQLVEVNAVKQSIDWGSVFGEFRIMFREQLQPTIDKLRAISRSDEFKSSGLENQQALYDLITKLEQSNAVWDSDIFKKVSDDLVAYQSAMRNYIDAQERERQATEALSQAKRELERAEKSGDVTGALDARTKITEIQLLLDAASDDVKNFGMQVQQTTSDLQSSSSQAVSMFQDLESGLKGLASGNLQGIGEGIMRLDKIFNKGELTKTVGNSLAKGFQSLFGKDAKASKAISEALGNSGLIGAIISAILSILDILKDGVGALVSSLIDTILNAVSGILKNILNGDTFVQIFDSVKSGIGGILDAVTWGGFSSWISSSNAKEVAETTERLTNSNERLKDAVDNLKDEMSKSGGWKAINATKQAKEDQKKINDQTMQILQTQMGYHGAHHSNAYYWGLGRTDYASINRTLADYKRKNPLAKTETSSVHSLTDIYKLTPEQMNYIRTYNIEMWEKMLEQGKYDKSEYWDNYADLAGELEAITEALKETLTQTSFDSLRDSFVDALLDMNASAEDFADDFSEYMMKSILNAKIADLLDDELQEFYNKWAEYAESGNEITDAEQKALNNMWNALVQKGLDIRDQVSAFTGYTGGDKESSSGLSKGIQSITENTADLLASYINAMRSDLSVIRSIVEQKSGESDSNYFVYMSDIIRVLSGHSSLFETNNTIALAQLQQLTMIVSNTSRTADSNDKILEAVSELRDDVHGAKTDRNRGWHIQ